MLGIFMLKREPYSWACQCLFCLGWAGYRNGPGLLTKFMVTTLAQLWNETDLKAEILCFAFFFLKLFALVFSERRNFFMFFISLKIKGKKKSQLRISCPVFLFFWSKVVSIVVTKTEHGIRRTHTDKLLIHSISGPITIAVQ